MGERGNRRRRAVVHAGGRAAKRRRWVGGRAWEVWGWGEGKQAAGEANASDWSGCCRVRPHCPLLAAAQPPHSVAAERTARVVALAHRTCTHVYVYVCVLHGSTRGARYRAARALGASGVRRVRKHERGVRQTRTRPSLDSGARGGPRGRSRSRRRCGGQRYRWSRLAPRERRRECCEWRRTVERSACCCQPSGEWRARGRSWERRPGTGAAEGRWKRGRRRRGRAMTWKKGERKASGTAWFGAGAKWKRKTTGSEAAGGLPSVGSVLVGGAVDSSRGGSAVAAALVTLRVVGQRVAVGVKGRWSVRRGRRVAGERGDRRVEAVGRGDSGLVVGARREGGGESPRVARTAERATQGGGRAVGGGRWRSRSRKCTRARPSPVSPKPVLPEIAVTAVGLRGRFQDRPSASGRGRDGRFWDDSDDNGRGRHDRFRGDACAIGRGCEKQSAISRCLQEAGAAQGAQCHGSLADGAPSGKKHLAAK